MYDPDADLVEGGPDDLIDHPERYELDLDGVAWALRAIDRAERTAATLKAQHDAAVARAKEWYRDRVAGPERAAAAARALVERFSIAARADGIKTIDTPWGVVASRARPDAFAFDELAVVQAMLDATVELRINEDDEPDELNPHEVWFDSYQSIINQLRAAVPLLKVTIALDGVAFRRQLAEGPGGVVVHAESGTIIEGATVVKLEPSVTIKPADAAPGIANPVAGVTARAIPTEHEAEGRVLPRLVDDAELQAKLDGLVHAFINEREGDVTQAEVDEFAGDTAAALMAAPPSNADGPGELVGDPGGD